MTPPKRPREDALFLRFRTTGDRTALAEVYELITPELRLVAERHLGDACLAEDAIQQTFLAALRNADRYDEERPLRPWLVSILLNESRSIRRRARTRREHAFSQTAITESTDPHVLVSRTELQTSVRVAIGTLPAIYQPVLSLRLHHGLTNRAIAQRLSRPEATVRIQMMRGLRLLRRALPAWAAGSIFASAALAASSKSKRRVDRWMWPPALPAFSSALFLAAAVTLAVCLLWFQGDRGGVERFATSASIVPTVVPDVETEATELERIATETDRTPSSASALASLELHVFHEDGSPATETWVRTRPIDVSNPFLHEVWSRSDAAGHVSFRGIPEGRVEIVGDRGGRLTTRVGADGPTAAQLRIPDGYHIEGRVVDTLDEPVENAGVWLSLVGDPSRGHVITRTNSEGRFRIAEVSGERFVGAHHEDLAATTLARASAAEGGRVEITLRMAMPHGSIRGTVVDDDGAAVPRARITVHNREHYRQRVDCLGELRFQWPAIQVLSDDEGRFHVTGIPLGPVLVTAAAARWVGDRISLEIADGRESTVDLRLTNTCLRGRVTDRTGRAVADARVFYMSMADSLDASGVVTDRDGRFSLRGFPSLIPTLWVDGATRGVATGTLRLQAGRATEWNPVLHDTRQPLWGVLRDADGNPLRDWKIDARPMRNTRDPFPIQTQTDAFGRFALRHVDQIEHLLLAIPPGCTCPCGPGERILPGHHEQRITIATANLPTAVVKARVVDRRGDTVPNCKIALTRPAWVTHNGLYENHIWLDPATDGSWSRGGIPPGTYSVRIFRAGHPPYALDPIELLPSTTLDLGDVWMRSGDCGR